MYNDKNLTCADCGQEFVFTASEQDFYAQRGFTEPRRCPSCRASRKAARNAEGGGSSYGGYGAGGGYSAGGSSYGGSGGYGSRDRGPREMFTATCSSCGKEARCPSARPAASPSTAATASAPSAAADPLSLSVRADSRPAEPASIPDPGRQPAWVVRFSEPPLSRSGACRPADPRSNLRSVPWSSRSMLSAWAIQMSAAPTAE